MAVIYMKQKISLKKIKVFFSVTILAKLLLAFNKILQVKCLLTKKIKFPTIFSLT
jgi:hypothetical protein